MRKKFWHFRLPILLTAALLLQMLLPFFATYQIPAQSNASLFGEKILLCTADGFRWVKWEDLQSGKEQPAPHAKYKCPSCYLAAHNTFIGAADAGVVPAPSTNSMLDAALFAPEKFTARDLLWVRWRTRAPPVFSFS